MRCFVAIELPDDVRGRLASLQAKLASLGRDVRWTRPEQLHLTVKFLGEVRDAQVAEVCDGVRQVAGRYPAFELEIKNTGCFPPHGPVRILWAGLPDVPQTLIDCQRDCEESLAALGFAPENRPFSPHLTIGRVNNGGPSARIRQEILNCAPFYGGRVVATELTIFESQLRPTGSIHTPLARAPLQVRD